MPDQTLTNLASEPTFADAQCWWSKMRRPATFPGVPGYPWQPAVLWNAGVLFSPIPGCYGKNEVRLGGPSGYMRELEGYETDALQIEFSFGTSFHFPDRMDNTGGEISQELLDGRLPVIISRLEHDGLQWTGTVFSRLLEGEAASRGDETLLTEVCWTVHNPGPEARPVQMACHLAAPHCGLGYKAAQNEKTLPYLRALSQHEGQVRDDRAKGRLALQAEGGLQAAFHAKLPEDMIAREEVPLADFGLHRDVILINGEVPPGATGVIRLLIPFFAVEPAVLEEAVSTSYDEALAAVRGYWEREFAAAGRIETPDRIVNDCFDAYLYHAMLATGRKPRSGYWILKTSPNNYEHLWGAHASIAAFSMDLRGKHAWSRPIFETFLATQGPVGTTMTTLFGHDRAKESEGYTDHPGFLGNIDGHMAIIWAFYHGWTMWAIGQHARLSGDWAWLKGHADQLALACEWIAEQRRRTMRTDENGEKVLAYGLLPAGNAFDWGFGHVFWSDAHTWRGLQEAAECLRIVGHPRAAEFLAETEAYRQDIITAVTRCRDAAPPVPLDDGSTIPYVPCSVEMLDYFAPDWTYVIAGALNLVWCGIVPADHELITQTLAFLDAGRPLGEWSEAQQKYQGWDWGARVPADEDFLECTRPSAGRAFHWRHKMTYEPGWTPQGFTFMLRDDLPAYLEYFYSLISNGGQHVEVRTPIEQRDGVPWTQPGDANLLWLMRDMLVREDGAGLLLAPTCPRAWYADGQTIAATDLLTTFGRVSFRLDSQVKAGRITGNCHFDFQNAPAQIRLRLRHPEGIKPKAVIIDGQPGTCNGEWIILPAGCKTFEVRWDV